MSNWAKEVEPYVRGQVGAALSVAGDGASEGERGAAARVVRALVGAFMHDRLDEVQATDIANVMGRRLDEAQVVGHLLRALVVGSSNPEKLTVGIERLAHRTTKTQLRKCLWHRACGMLESPVWRARVREAWVRDALAFATNPPPLFTVLPERLMRAWLDLHGSVPTWMAEFVEPRPDLLLSAHLPSRWVWRYTWQRPPREGGTFSRAMCRMRVTSSRWPCSGRSLASPSRRSTAPRRGTRPGSPRRTRCMARRAGRTAVTVRRSPPIERTTCWRCA